jgi:hypothetical protein
MTGDQTFELLGWLVGGGLGIAAVVAGNLVAMRWRRTARPKLICTCGHGYGAHDPIEGMCGDQVHRTALGWVDCPCRTYDGPDPLVVRR